MNRSLTMLLLLGALGGCSQQQGNGRHTPSVADAGAAQDRAGTQPAAKRTLAYRHALTLDVAEDKVAQVFEAGQAACRAMTTAVCTVLNAQRDSGAGGHAGARNGASAQLTMRALPAAIPKLIAALGPPANIARQATSAEELAGPLEDQAKKLALLTDYRTKLEALRVQAASNIDSLIKVNHELAQVQGQLEAAAGAQAALQQRVDTELLEVEIASRTHQSFWHPIAQSLGEFGPSLAQGTAFAISGAAWLLPWAVLLGLFGWVARKLWRRRK